MPAIRLDARAGRLYFAVQALAGAGWWVGVFFSDSIRSFTLGSWTTRGIGLCAIFTGLAGDEHHGTQRRSTGAVS